MDVVDTSDIITAQPHGVDFVWLQKDGDRMKSVMVDVKMDMLYHRTGNLFIETKSSKNKDGCLLTSSAEMFLYFCPFRGQLFHVNIPLLKAWYMKHKKKCTIKKVKNVGYESEGFCITPDLLIEMGFAAETAIAIDKKEEAVV